MRPESRMEDELFNKLEQRQKEYATAQAIRVAVVLNANATPQQVSGSLEEVEAAGDRLEIAAALLLDWRRISRATVKHSPSCGCGGGVES